MTDNQSINGTFVNDRQTLQCFLSDGDRIRFGPVECVFHLPPPAPKISGRENGRLGRITMLVSAAFLVTLAAIFAAYIFWPK